MNNITFKNIHHFGDVICETDLYELIHFSDMLLFYDANFLRFKRMPTIQEFKDAEKFLRDFHLSHGQKHVKFTLPENEKPDDFFTNFLIENGYQVGYLELFGIEPSQFPDITPNPNIHITKVTKETLSEYLNFQYNMDKEFGEDFASDKQKIHKQIFESNHFDQIVSYYNGEIVGSLTVIIGHSTAEIDGFSVSESYQRKGIGSLMQKYVMELYHDKTIILVADGQDTPRNMYLKQNYQLYGVRYDITKVYE